MKRELSTGGVSPKYLSSYFTRPFQPLEIKRHKIALVLYNRLLDPLVQSNIFLYIEKLSLEKCYEFSVVTFEDESFPILPEEKIKIQHHLKELGVHWIPLAWHPSTQIFKKISDVVSALKIFLKLKYQKKYQGIVSLGTPAGGLAYIISLFCPMKLFLYQYEPHSLFMLETGNWKKNSPAFQILRFLERKSAQKASVISSGTEYMLDELCQKNIKASLFKITSVVNDELFQFQKSSRMELRKKMGISDKDFLFVYAGKFGGIYYDLDFFKVCKALEDLNQSIRFLILSPHPIAEIENYIEKSKGYLPSYTISSVDYKMMPHYLSAADFGIISVPPTPSQKYRSPIKTGEYLCCGLPYLVCQGISEDDLVAEKYQVGVVVKEFSTQEIKKVYPQIMAILDSEKSSLLSRCRRAGIEYRGFQNQYDAFKKGMKALSQSIDLKT